MKINKNLIIIPVLGGILYFFLSFHIIFVGKKPVLLKKSELTLNYTIYSTSSKNPVNILKIDALRQDGIGEILVENGLMGRAQLNRILIKYGEDYYEDDEYEDDY